MLADSITMPPLQYSVGTRLYAFQPLPTSPQLPATKPEPIPLTIRAEPRAPAIKAEPKSIAIKAEPQPPMIKPEPVEDRVSNRKRSRTQSVLPEIFPKKLKASPENPTIPTIKADFERPLSMSAEAIRDELLDLQREINHLQPQLDKSKRKAMKTTGELTREMNITKQLIDLYQRRKELTEMLPAVSAPVQPIAGPSYQTDFTYGFTQPEQPPVSTVPFASGSNLLASPLKDEPMDTDSEEDNAAPLPTSDMDPSRPLADGDGNGMFVDGTNFGVDFYHHNTAKADEWVCFSTFQSSPVDAFV